MSFSELVDAIAQRTRLPKGEIKTILKSFAEVTKDVTATGESVNITNFGAFYLQEIESRTMFGRYQSKGSKKIRFRQSRSR